MASEGVAIRVGGREVQADTFATERAQVGRDFLCITVGPVQLSKAPKGFRVAGLGMKLGADDAWCEGMFKRLR